MRAALIAVLLGATACASGGVEGGDSEGDEGDTEARTTGVEPTGADNLPPGEATCPCAGDSDDIHVLSDFAEIWAFDPETLEFSFVTAIDCGGMSDAISIGVGRTGRAWIAFASGELYTVDLKDPEAACRDPLLVNEDPRFPRLGVAFAADSEADRCDRLYAYGCSEPEAVGEDVGALGVIDPQTVTLAQIGPIDYGWGALTGTGDGRLFALEGVSPRVLTEYDKTTAARLGSWALPALGVAGETAFALWGGTFYFFTEPEPRPGLSRVSALEFDEMGGMALKTVVEEAPLRVVAAGVSTCAPACPGGRGACPSR